MPAQECCRKRTVRNQQELRRDRGRLQFSYFLFLFWLVFEIYSQLLPEEQITVKLYEGLRKNKLFRSNLGARLLKS